MSDIRYRGKSIDELSVDELRAAVRDCLAHGRATAAMHQHHIAMLRNLISKDEHDAERLFLHAARQEYDERSEIS